MKITKAQAATYAALILAVYAAILTTMSLFSNNNQKFAYVINAEIFERYTGAVEANKVFEQESQQWQANINTLKTELDSLNFLFVKDSDKWSTKKKKEMTAFAQKKQEDFQRYSQAIQQKAAVRKNELMSPIVVEINAKIADYAKAHGYTMIFGTTDGNIVYAEDAVNITADVIDVLNLNKKP